MVNELLWIITLVLSFLGVTVAYRVFGKAGLYSWIAMCVIIVNIQVLKTIEIFGFVTALGNILYGSIFLATDILNENHGKRAARKGVWIGFFILLAVTALLQLSLLFVPDRSDFITPALEQVFGVLPRIAFASLAAYLVSHSLDVVLFARIKALMRGRMLWLRNNLSTMVSQLVDNVIFTAIAFVGVGAYWPQVFPWPVIISIFLTSYVMKFVVAALDTPFLYLARRWKATSSSGARTSSS